MTKNPSNILSFPIRHAPIQPASQPMAAEPEVLHLQATGHKSLVADDEFREHVATIVGVAIRCGRRKGRSLSSLQPQLRKWLIDLCDQGEPSAVMVHDWLTGNRRHLTPDFDPAGSDGQRTSKRSVEMGEGA
ncbi:hypothetical protein C8J32_1096 [Rhizobium sp. PP-CC-3A-592]|nr:hypothetical protein C8J32_1096 [Rhizobium sp. PP-CC-3A-592]